MREIPLSDIHRRAGDVLEIAEAGPVALTRYSRARFVLMSADHYETLGSADDATDVTAVAEVPKEAEVPAQPTLL